MIEQKLKKILADLLDINLDQVSLESSINNTERWDSLTHFKLIANLEQEFNIKFAEEELLKLNSVAQILAILKEKNIQGSKTKEKTLKEIISKTMNVEVENINESFSTETASSWDSFTGMMLFSEIEKKFNVRLTTEEVMTIRSYKDIREVLEKHGALDDGI